MLPRLLLHHRLLPGRPGVAAQRAGARNSLIFEEVEGVYISG